MLKTVIFLKLLFTLGVACAEGVVVSAPDVSANVLMKHAQHAGMHAKAELGASVAVDDLGQLWMVKKETADKGPAAVAGQFVVLQMSRDGGASWTVPVRVFQTPEPVSADGENRPKLAFGLKGEIYVTYTKPLTKLYTGEIRFVRSLDGGKTFSAPMTVHANHDEITHRFESMVVDRAGRICIAWIDKRDEEAARQRHQPYGGAAIYYAVSTDAGASFNGDIKVAEHACECCRIALALNSAGQPVALWRHVFGTNSRDHALAVLTPDGKSVTLERASFDDWHIDACPHQGPSLAFSDDGLRYQTWFDLRADPDHTGNTGGLLYAATDASGQLQQPLKLGSAQAEHAEVAVQRQNEGQVISIVWKQFDGTATTIVNRYSRDAGVTWQEHILAQTRGNSDHPHLLLLSTGIMLVWSTELDGVLMIHADGVDADTAKNGNASANLMHEFTAASLTELMHQQAGHPFVLVVWSLDCEYCQASLDQLSKEQRAHPDLRVVTLSTDSADDAVALAAMQKKLAALSLMRNAWAFGDVAPEQLRYAIDPKWHGEMPRSYWFDADGRRAALSGTVTHADVERFLATPRLRP